MDTLPPELLTHVFEYLDFKDTLTCSLVNHAWFTAADDFLWLSQLQSILPDSKPRAKNLRTAYIQERKKQHYSRIVQKNFNVMKPRAEKCRRFFWIFGVVFTICIGASWFGIFFGISYKEIQAGTPYYLDVACSVNAHSWSADTCLNTVCGTCNECINNNTCTRMFGVHAPVIGETLGCCGGYYCCQETCQTCRTCVTVIMKGRLTEQCSYSSCNCVCRMSIPQRQCTITNSTCTRGKAFCTMTVPVNTTLVSQTKEIEVTCSGDPNSACMNSFFENYQIGKSVSMFYPLPSGTDYKPPYTTRNIVLLVVFTPLFAFSLIITLGCFVSQWIIYRCNKPLHV
jgi:hypothetical protein